MKQILAIKIFSTHSMEIALAKLHCVEVKSFYNLSLFLSSCRNNMSFYSRTHKKNIQNYFLQI